MLEDPAIVLCTAFEFIIETECCGLRKDTTIIHQLMPHEPYDTLIESIIHYNELFNSHGCTMNMLDMLSHINRN